MDGRILKLAMNVLWCDIKHCFKGYRIFVMLVIAVFALLPPDDNMFGFYFAWVIEMALMRLIPSCDRIFFVMPIGAADRKKLMMYRQFVGEMIFVVLLFAAAGVKYLFYGDAYQPQMYIANSVILIALMFFEMGSAYYFCGWYDAASMREKGFGVFFSVLAWISFIIALCMLAYDKGRNCNVVAVMLFGFGGILVQALVKLYYMRHSDFEEYKIVNVNEGLNGTSKNKTNAADERF